MTKAVPHPDTLEGLLDIVRTLRSPDGCPWDRKQTAQDLVKYLIDETYEVAEAIETGEPAPLQEELGDLLFQIIFLIVLAEEKAHFKAEDVIRGIGAKMIRRHPHVFGDASVNGVADVLKNWEDIKATQEGKPRKASLFDGIPRGMPALERAQEVTARAAKVGFDWPVAEPVLDKLDEEIREAREALAQGRREAIRDEVGDLLFTVVNLARFAGCRAEGALRATTDKFIRRFTAVEQRLKTHGKTLSEASLEDMDREWDAVKQEERNSAITK